MKNPIGSRAIRGTLFVAKSLNGCRLSFGKPWLLTGALAALIAVAGPGDRNGGGYGGFPTTAAAVAEEQEFGAHFIPRRQNELPHPARTVEEALEHWSVPEGFKVELVASEPMLVNPIDMTIDERGRFWLVESVEYPRKEGGPGEDRIRVLEDTTGDGKIDKSWIFADGLNIPCGIAVGYGGVWVSNSPDILFFQDTTGDGKADTREVVVTGFGREDSHELPNSLTWGPDGWLYGLNGVFNPSRIEQGGEIHRFDAAVFRIHPVTHEFQVFAEGTSNPWGIAFAPDGSLIVVACVIDHLWHIAEGGHYVRQAGSHPPHTWEIGSIVNHSHHLAAYCGLVYLDSDAYPEAYRDTLYMGNIHGAKINADVLERRGSTWFAAPSETRVLMESNDVWHMPVDQEIGPDGLLYVLDWYDRYNCYQDALFDPDGVDRQHGRLWRLNHVDAETPRRPAEDMGALSDASLIERLSSANIYHRETAQRLLAERLLYGTAAPETRNTLEGLVLAEATEFKTRMHALFSMISSFELDPDFHEMLFEHEVDSVRAWAVRAAGNFADEIGATVRSRVLERVDDPSPEVQLQVAVAVPKLLGEEAVQPLVKVLAAAGSDPLIPRIVWRNLHPLLPEHSQAFTVAVAEHDLNESEALRLVVRRAGEKLAGATPEESVEVAASGLSEEERVLFGEGRTAYQTCLACHGAHGQGIPRVASPLDGSRWVDADAEALVRIVLHGFEGEDPEIGAAMPPHRFLADDEIAAILTFIRHSWSNEAPPITPDDVARIHEETRDRLRIWTVEELEALLDN